MSDLLPKRLSSLSALFHFTREDYFEPLIIILNKKTRGTSGTAKRYSARFTCMTIQAVHLELASDLYLSRDNFIFAQQCFKARRGHPKHIESNNETNSIRAERETKDTLTKLNQT